MRMASFSRLSSWLKFLMESNMPSILFRIELCQSGVADDAGSPRDGGRKKVSIGTPSTLASDSIVSMVVEHPARILDKVLGSMHALWAIAFFLRPDPLISFLIAFVFINFLLKGFPGCLQSGH